jgi:hypothetical protein
VEEKVPKSKKSKEQVSDEEQEEQVEEKVPKSKKQSKQVSDEEQEEKVPKSKKQSKEQVNTYDFSEFGVEYVSIETLKKMVSESNDKLVKEYFNCINDKIIPEMNKAGIKTFIVPSPLTKKGKAIKDIEYTGQYLKQVYGYENEDCKINDFVFVFHIDKTVETKFGIKIDFELNAKALKMAKTILKNNLLIDSFQEWDDTKYKFIKNISYYYSQEF